MGRLLSYRCDHPGCDAAVDIPDWASTEKYVGAKSGWRFTTRGDLCPQHAKEFYNR